MIDAIPLLAGAGADGYQISRSVRLRSSASAYLNRTFTTPTNVLKWSWSGWVKRGQIGVTYAPIFAGGTSGSAYAALWFNNDNLVLYSYNGATVYQLTTSAVYRDPSAWYHIQIAFDSTQATASNRLAMYVNGVQITAFAAATYPSLNYSGFMNSAIAHYFGQFTPALGASYFDGYLTEVNFIDGQALTPSSFGETNLVTGVWQPKRYAGTYGTNGFYLNFSDNSGVTATTIGKDYSGNGNNWTPSAGISITAGATYDSMIDVPTLYADGGNGRGNYCTLNPLNQNSVITLSAGNLSFTASNNRFTTGTFAVTSGKWYWEFYPVAGGASGVGVGAISATTYVFGTAAFSTAAGYIGVGYTSNGSKYISGTSSAYGATYGSGNVIGVALDLDSGTKTITFYKNNISQGSINLPTSSEAWIVATDYSEAGTHSINFGQRPFTYTPPTGFVALNTQNLPTPTIVEGNAYFDVVTRNGTGSAVSVSSLSFQPDSILTKLRNTAYNWYWADAVRGVSKTLSTDTTAAEQTPSPALYTSFDSNGYTLGTNTGSNGSTYTYVDYVWNAGGSTVTNTSGTISSQVRANPTAGFSVVTYTGTGANATVGHGLNATPAMIMVKNRDSGAIGGAVYHTSMGATKYLKLFQTTTGSDQEAIDNTAWNGGSPTFNSSVFSVGSLNRTNSSQQMVAYCFAAVAGYSAFGKYTGNGVPDGPFVYLGFRPRFVLFKRTDAANDWVIHDSSRNTFNVVDDFLKPNLSNAEGAYSTSGHGVDFLSSGMKLRTDSGQLNASTGTYIYAAFAENPFKLSLAR